MPGTTISGKPHLKQDIPYLSAPCGNHTLSLHWFRLRGCLHDTGASFTPKRVHSGSLSWLYICLHDTTTKCYAGASHPSVSSPQFSHRGENFTPVRNLATVSCIIIYKQQFLHSDWLRTCQLIPNQCKKV